MCTEKLAIFVRWIQSCFFVQLSARFFPLSQSVLEKHAPLRGGKVRVKRLEAWYGDVKDELKPAVSAARILFPYTAGAEQAATRG